MGLDGVELVIELEDEFAIKIPDEAAGKMARVRDIVDFVDSRFRRRARGHCRTSRAFYAIRRRFCGLLAVPRRKIGPALSLEALVPRDLRRDVWQDLELAGYKPPPLRRPSWVGWVSSLIVISLAGGLAALFHDPWMMLNVVTLGLMAVALTEPLAVEVPETCPTVGDLAAKAATMRRRGAVPSRADLSHKVRLIIAEQMAIPPSTVKEDSHLIDDLGIGR